MKLKTILNVIIIIVVTLSVSTFKVNAEDRTSMKQYSVTPIFDEFQNKDIKSYFNLNLTDGDTYDSSLLFEVENKTSKEIELEVKSLNAFTSPQGVIQYDIVESDTNYMLTDETKKFMNYSLENQIVTIPPKDIITIGVPVKTDSIEGTLIGGISFTMLDEESNENSDSQFNILNELKTIIAVVINTDSSLDYNNIEYGKPFINTMPSYYAVRLPIENKGDNLFTNIRVAYSIVGENGETLFGNTESKFINLTPKTKINFPMAWDYPKIVKGEKYRLIAKIYYPDDTVVQIDESVVLTGEESVYGVNVESGTPVVVEEESDEIATPVRIFIIVLALIALIYLYIKWRCKD